MKVYLVTAEHFSVPGLVVRVFETKDDALNECVELVNIMLEDMKLPHADLANWEACLELVQDTHGTQHCYVEVSEQDVIPAPALN